MATIEQVTALLGVIAAAHPDRFEITDERIDVYADLLADLDITDLKAATRQHLATSPHPPTIADLRRLCAQVSAPAMPDWGEAWRELLDQIGRVGSYGAPSWSHPVIAEAVRQFGPWREVCAMEIDQTPTNRAQFRQIYEAIAGRAQRTAALLPEVRALAVARGALPLPAEAVPTPALPAPRDASKPGVPISYADFRHYRAEQVAEREAAGRAAYDLWLASQQEEGHAV
jgi:hypothetical protein